MAKKQPSSRRKPSTKAGSRTRSTTSSTTGSTRRKTARRAEPQAHEITEPVRPKLFVSALNEVPFGPEQQEAYLLLLAKGASPAVACAQLNLSLPAVAEKIESDENFRKLVGRVNELLSQNVAAALYRSAMEGSVSAQTFYLKNRPPPGWFEDEVDPHSQLPCDLTDDELIAEFRKTAPALLDRLAAADSAATGSGGSGDVSQHADSSGAE